jgi:hypothetical protein
MEKPGRNKPCPCGSGKKYKYCCQRIGANVESNPFLFGKDSKHIAGKSKEVEIHQLLEKGMLSDFVFKNPIVSNTGHEICDAIIYFEEIIIIIQIKSTQKPEKQANKIVDKGIRQSNGAFRYINNCTSLEIKNDRQGTIKIDKLNEKKIISILILSAQDYECFGSLFKADVKEPFVHVFDEDNLKELIDILDTPPDLINYLIKREELLTKYESVFASERDLLGNYITHGHSFNLPEGAEQERPDQIILTGFWTEENHGLISKLKERKELNSHSYVFDFIINEVHKCVEPGYIKIATEFSKFDRLKRRMIGDKIYEFGLRALQKQADISGILILNETKQIILLLFSDLSREKRREKLIVVSKLACYKYKIEKAYGIATEIPPPYPYNKPYSFDFCLLNTPWVYDKELEIFSNIFKKEKENYRVSEF